MTQIVDWNKLIFPELGWEFTVNSDAFTVFGLTIKWYGIMITLGLLLAFVYCFRRMKSYGLDQDRVVDAVFFGLIGGIVGARAYFVLMQWDNYKDNLSSVFSIRDGGLAIYGGIIGSVIIGCIVAKIRKVRIAPLLDLAGMGFLIGQGFGRWGNFFNHEAFGSNTNLPWGMTSLRIQNYLSENANMILETTGTQVDPLTPVHPCFLYESLWCFIGFLLIHLYSKKRKFDGEMFLLYVGWYGIGRFFIEGLRTDSLMIGHIRVSQLVAGICVLVALIIILAKRRKIALDGEYTFYKDTEESKMLLKQAEEKANRKVSKKAETKITSDENKKEDIKEENKDGEDN